MRKIRSATFFNIVLGTLIEGGLPRPDGRPGCVIAIRPGINLVPDELIEHPYLRSHIDAGLVTLPDVDEPERPRTISKYLRDDFHAADNAGLPNPFGAAQQITEPTPTDLTGAVPKPEQERQSP
jgi:hypothetical protein